MVGFVNVYKERGESSFNVVRKIKKIFNEKRVGHLGTLDPMAEGVLPVAVGKATKMFDYYLHKKKSYIATFKIGEETDTLDLEGEVIKTSTTKISDDDIQKVLPKFVGKILQTPPKFSAVKINGKRAYDLARDNKDFDIAPKEVEIYTILPMASVLDNLLILKIDCSAGTYIRSLGRDILNSLGSCCTMTKLVRTQSGDFNLDGAKTIEEIQKDPEGSLILVQQALTSLPVLKLPKSYFSKIKNGVRVPTDNFDIQQNENLLVYAGDFFMGIGEVVDNKLVIKINLYEGE